jgi:hypothetical protein
MHVSWLAYVVCIDKVRVLLHGSDVAVKHTCSRMLTAGRRPDSKNLPNRMRIDYSLFLKINCRLR